MKSAQDGSVSVKKKSTEELTDIRNLKKNLCPRCGRKLSILEKDDGTEVPWCFWEQSPFLNTTELGGKDDDDI